MKQENSQLSSYKRQVLMLDQEQLEFREEEIGDGGGGAGADCCLSRAQMIG